MSFLKVGEGGDPVQPIQDMLRAILNAAIAWSRTRTDIVSLALLAGPTEDDPEAVIEILVLTRNRAALNTDNSWHAAALGGREALRRQDDHFERLSSRLLMLDDVCVQFWVADAPP